MCYPQFCSGVWLVLMVHVKTNPWSESTETFFQDRLEVAENKRDLRPPSLSIDALRHFNFGCLQPRYRVHVQNQRHPQLYQNKPWKGSKMFKGKLFDPFRATRLMTSKIRFPWSGAAFIRKCLGISATRAKTSALQLPKYWTWLQILWNTVCMYCACSWHHFIQSFPYIPIARP